MIDWHISTKKCAHRYLVYSVSIIQLSNSHHCTSKVVLLKLT